MYNWCKFEEDIMETGKAEGTNREMKHVVLAARIDDMMGVARKAEELVAKIKGEKGGPMSEAKEASLRKIPSFLEVISSGPLQIAELNERILKALFTIEELIF